MILEYELTHEVNCTLLEVFYKNDPKSIVMAIRVGGHMPIVTASLENCRTNHARQLVNYFMQKPLSKSSDFWTVRDILVMEHGILHTAY